MKPIIGITMGDPCGIGPEITLKALHDKSVLKICELVIIGDYHYLIKTQNFFAKKCRLAKSNLMPIFKDLSSELANQKKPVIPVIDLHNIASNQKLLFGRATSWGGKASGEYIEMAIKSTMRGIIDAMVTCPINKVAFKLGGWGRKYTGHTEMLKSLTSSKNVALLMVRDNFRVIHLTSHVPLSKIPALVKKQNVLKTIQLAYKACKNMGVQSPKIAVSGLNPHGGEEGILGTEEIKEIRPAVKNAQKMGLHARGPFPPDSIWPLVLQKKFDIGVAMYHDQGQIPLKMMGMSRLVNITAGIPIIRTSVGHGTAYDISGKGIADPSSLIQAIIIASQMVKNSKKINDFKTENSAV